MCPYHGHSSLNCPDCRANSKRGDAERIKSGQWVYIACAWRFDCQYSVDQANGCKVFKRKAAAEKWCTYLNGDALAMGANPRGYVVRLVPVQSPQSI